MTIFNKVNDFIQQHQTRQQLRDLPEYLLKDIGKTQKEINRELSKSSFIHCLKAKLTFPVRPLLKKFNKGLSFK